MTDDRPDGGFPVSPSPSASPSPVAPVPRQRSDDSPPWATPPFPPPAAPTSPPAAPTSQAAVGPARSGRLPRWVLAVAAGTAVASVAAFLLGFLWPTGQARPAGPLEFHGFAHVGQVPFDTSTRAKLTAAEGDSGYVGYEDEGDLRLIGFELTTGQERWRRTISGAPGWDRLIATPQLVVALAFEADRSLPRKLFALDPQTGDTRWDINVRGNDQLFFNDRALIWVDRNGQRLRGYRVGDGEQLWSLPIDANARVLPVTTTAALARPTDATGLPGPLGDDRRLVVVDPDRTVRMVDGHDGAVLEERANVANPRDLLLAYEERLFVLTQESGYRVEAYDLVALDGPSRAIYTSSNLERYPDALHPCGPGRVCVLDTLGFDRVTAVVTAVDVVDGGPVWQRELAGAERLLPVGDWLAVTASVDFTAQVLLVDRAGEIRHTQPGRPLRLNDGNLLLVDRDWAAATGFALARGEPTGLGPLPEVRTPSDCAWNDHLIACAGAEAIDIWRFASD